MMNSDQIFLLKDVKGSKLSKYNKQLVGIVVSSNNEESLVDQHMEMDCFDTFELRKREATTYISGTTTHPSETSIAHWGDRSVRTLLDCYWHFCPIGDKYLGQIAVGLYPNFLDFDILPSHWTLHNLQSNADIVDIACIVWSNSW